MSAPIVIIIAAVSALVIGFIAFMEKIDVFFLCPLRDETDFPVM